MTARTFTGTAFFQSHDWNGFVVNSGTTTNWTPNGFPTAADDVDIGFNGAFDVTLAIAAPGDPVIEGMADSLTIEAGSSLTVSNTGTLTLGSGAGNSGNALVNNAKITIADPSNSKAVLSVAGNTTNTGTILVDQGVLALSGVITNTGTITLVSDGFEGYQLGALSLAPGDVTLMGGGKIVLAPGSGGPAGNGGTNVMVVAAGPTPTILHNLDNVISGFGYLGDGRGLVPSAALTIANQGTILADNTASSIGLVIEATINQVGDPGNDGVVAANGAGSHVDLLNGTIIGGLLSTTNGGVINVVAGHLQGDTKFLIDGSAPNNPVTIAAKVLTAGNDTLHLKGAIVDNGTLQVDGSASNGASINIDSGDATLSGSGVLTLFSSSLAEITGSSTTATTLHNSITISGSGNIGTGRLGGLSEAGNRLSFDNQASGVINADGNGGVLNLTDSISNVGLIEDTGTAGLAIATSINQIGTGGQTGTISANGAGSHVDLANGTIIGGSLTASGGGVFNVTANGDAGSGVKFVLDGSAGSPLTNAAQILTAGEETLYLKGTIINKGTLSVDGSASNGAGIDIDQGDATLTGSGTLTLLNNLSEITGSKAATTLHNASTIAGVGRIGTGSFIGNAGNLLIFDNQLGGTVDANASKNSLTIGTGATVTNSGILEADGGTLVINDSVTGGGSALITGGGTLSFDLGANFQQDLTFSGAGRLNLPEASASGGGYIGHISGWGSTDTVDVNPLAFKSSYQVLIGAEGGSNQGLFVVDSANNNALVAQMNLTGSYAPGNFVLSDDNGGGTLISEQPVCFCRGTLILTERGEVAVEDLAVGDRVVTTSGALKPIRWIGLGRDLVTRANKLARPVIVRRGALADGVPARDLYLTHGHALYLDEVLIPVENLVNHRSIVWDEAARVVEYYHVELEDHDVLLANGAPAESYYDAGNRALFHNTRPQSLASAAKPTVAPVLTGGDAVERVWATLFKRAGGRFETDTTDDPDLHLVVDGVRLDPATVEGGLYNFALAAPPEGSLQLRSRSGVPSLFGITAHDHRRLGVAISRITLRQPGGETVIEPEAPLLLTGGCHPPEQGYCWTDGELELPPHLFAHLAGPFILTVHTERPGMRYKLPAPAVAA